MVDPNAKLSPLLEAQAIDAVERHLREGEPLLAYNAVQEGLAVWPQNLRLRQLQGLAIARSGDIERANALLHQLADTGNADAETLGILARTHKDLALRAGRAASRTAHLGAAFSIYQQAYEATRNAGEAVDAWYPGINAAAIAVLRGDLATARRIAAEVRTQCLRAQANPSAATDFWLAATLGEAALILGEPAESAAHYARAVRLAAGSYGNLGSTRRQAELLAQHLPGQNAWTAEVVKIPPLVMYTGHMIDQPTRAVPRFPLAIEGAVAAAIHQRLESIRPLASYGSAACGSDILCLEAMRQVGGETHIVLPFPPDDFLRISVAFGAGGWAERFERVLADATSVTITSDHRAHGSTATFEYANLVLTGKARLRAQVLGTDLIGLAVWDGKPATHASGAASLVRLWKSQRIDLQEVPITVNCTVPAAAAADDSGSGDDEQLPVGFSHEIRAMLFADAVGYSKLSEDETPTFITQFWGAVAELNSRTVQGPEHVETAGDGLYMVFGGVAEAGRYALELSELVTRTDWRARGLPAGMNIRVALHSGPVYWGRNPVTGLPFYTGPHTSHTARIEPITPPGHVYASSAFAAVAAANGVSNFSLSYVGRMPLAKGYGTHGIYHVGSATPWDERSPAQAPKT
ncbi:MAG TPA: tetratricopeptide repeat-containing protein [Steroidobacteraceae bacterium]